MTRESADRRREFQFEFWQQGMLLPTPPVMRRSPEWRAEAHALEQLMIFARFSDLDDGCSRIFLFACDTAEAAQEMVSTHNRLFAGLNSNPAKAQLMADITAVRANFGF